jgi:cysteine desulfurase/selenocysteine lyase
LPWISLSKRVGCELRVIELDDNGLIDCDALDGSLLDVRVFAFNHVSNVLGCENDVKRICEIAKESDVVTVVDGCQAVAHLEVDVKDLDCDFYAFSSHKMYGPTGAGALYGKYELLERIGSFMVGGGVVQNASMNNFSLAEIPQRFEPGTQSLAEVVGFGVACDFLNELGLSNVCEYEKSLLLVLKKSLSDVDGLRELSSSYSHSIFTFVVDGFNSHDIGDELADRGVCVRVGHHCAQPLIESLGENSVVRVSFGVYNELSDVENFVKMLKESLTALS